MKENLIEMNFDGLVGPTHNYAGLSPGNIASTNNKALTSNPRAAALQGLEKMAALANWGLPQGFLLPHERPHLPTLHRLGYKDAAAAYKANQNECFALYSASPAWAANAATVTASADSTDGRVHMTPANLTYMFHRSIEAATTSCMLKRIFQDETFFCHHDPLPPHPLFGDEGAANHTRLAGVPHAVQLFVFGQGSKKFPSRQSPFASQAILRLHKLYPESCLVVQQNPKAIDAGVFHNDVISVGHENVFLYHEEAFVNTAKIISRLKKLAAKPFYFIRVPKIAVPLQDAVLSYLFNSQIVSLSPEEMRLVAPQECQTVRSVNSWLEELLESRTTPIRSVAYFDLKESMQNGGGPACLRLRVPLTEKERQAVNQTFVLTKERYSQLKQWINTHYRDRLTPHDLGDKSFQKEALEALDALTKLLNLGSFYDFQRTC